MNIIIVAGNILAKAGTLDKLLALSLEHVRRSPSEPVCLAHAVHQDAENRVGLSY